MRKPFIWTGVLAACIVATCAVAYLLEVMPERTAVQPSAGIGGIESAAPTLDGAAYASSRDFPLPPPNTPIALVVKQLEKAALAGSPHAACRIAQETWRCSTVGASLDLAEILANVPALPAQGKTVSLPEDIVSQATSTAALCADVSTQLMSKAYSFQQIAADRGGESFQRWLVTTPALRQDLFLVDLDGWNDYRKRAKRYVERAIESRNGDNLLLLLAIHAPEQVRILRPPYQVEDLRTFLALMQIAERHRIAVPGELKLASDRVIQSMSEEEIVLTNRRAVELSDGWRFGESAQAVQDLFVEQQSDSFCR